MLVSPQWQKTLDRIKAPTIEPWRQLLLDAADAIDGRGHAMDQLMTDDGRVCLIGAIGVALGSETGYLPYGMRNDSVQEPALVALRKLTGGNIVDWNRAPGRTGAEAAAVCRAAARS